MRPFDAFHDNSGSARVPPPDAVDVVRPIRTEVTVARNEGIPPRDMIEFEMHPTFSGWERPESSSAR